MDCDCSGEAFSRPMPQCLAVFPVQISCFDRHTVIRHNVCQKMKQCLASRSFSDKLKLFCCPVQYWFCGFSMLLMVFLHVHPKSQFQLEGATHGLNYLVRCQKNAADQHLLLARMYRVWKSRSQNGDQVSSEGRPSQPEDL